MKRMHIEERRYGHHERATLAVLVGREVRNALKPLRLWLNAREQRNEDEEFAEAAALHEMSIKRMVMSQHRRVRLAAQRMRIERGVA